MDELYNKEDLIENIVTEIEDDRLFSEYSRIQLETICERYIVVNEESTYSAVMVKSDVLKGVSIKPENIFFQFKKCMVDIFALARNMSSFSTENSLKNIMVVIEILRIIYKVMSIKIDTDKCIILLAMHQLDAYDKMFDIKTVQREILDMGYEKIAEDDLRIQLAELSDIGCVWIEEERYGLREVVCCLAGR